MKKLLCTLLSCMTLFTITSCNNLRFGESSQNKYDDVNLEGYILKAAKPKYKVDVEVLRGEELKNYINKLNMFSSKLTDKIYKTFGEENINQTISPISIYMALAMAIEGADGKTRQEILDAVGVSYDEVSSYTTYLYSLLNREFQGEGENGEKVTIGYEILKNSIWIDNNVKLKEKGLSSLSNNYHTDSYHVPFYDDNKLANELLSKYVYDNTKGLIDSNFNLDKNTLFALVNTLYLKDVWNFFGNDLSFTKDNYTFTNNDGSSKNLKLLQGYYNVGKVSEEETFSHFFTTTENNFKIKFIVPKGDNKIEDVFNEENIAKVSEQNNYGGYDNENKIIHSTKVLFPEFEAEFDEDIKGVLNADFNIKELFIPQKNMPNLTDTELYCGAIIHKTKLKVDKVGIEGAAVTVMQMSGTSAGPDYTYEYHDFVVDRSFGFILTDVYNIPLFTGVVEVI